jgi:hypothetical protein
MRERPVTFGPGDGLLGVFTEPSPACERKDAPTLLSWNVGINHRIGPYRVLVDLARSLAARGFASLRFDLSGRGDSEARREASSEMERDLGDLREAMEVVAARRGPRFVVLGFCSSVDAAHRMALADHRVVGACFVEGYAYRTPGFYARHPLRLLEPARWRRLLARSLPPRARHWPIVGGLSNIPLVVPGDSDAYMREYPPPAQLRREYATLVERGTRMLFLYAGGGDSHYNHRMQLYEFGVSPRYKDAIDVEFYPRADHTFFRVEDRDRAVRRIGDWMEQQFAK